ncbi:hypothetical protein ERX46_17295 [Brumimicrobium glaciale]|uniref:Phage-Barnase-EndoU-ColicinE5/D-RelE like nuclease 2 domain-containing protein n=1 Tax=Brumimicrobium glaciale TaxID=200475 RepID=A0A4Q4KEF2_9FLAO|nr:hypothetical protein [Brumimicrobium glaciale]RYM30837.1 hypothetical protein ERX46_17295 [Brumimicrobium glaciale]
MPFNVIKKYPELLELNQFSPFQRKESLMRIFNRDIADNSRFFFREKHIRPTKIEGESPMQTLFNHLTTRSDEDEKGNKLGSRSFEMARSIRLHWIKSHIEESTKETVEVFSYEDRVKGKDVIRTYIYNKTQKYVIILEPLRNTADYYLLTAYPLNERGGKKQIDKKFKRKLVEVY